MYVGRSARVAGALESKWGNPIRISRDVSRADAVCQFCRYLWTSPSLLCDVPELAGKTLVCHCDSSQQCHADVLLDACRRSNQTPRSILVAVGTVLDEHAAGAASSPSGWHLPIAVHPSDAARAADAIENMPGDDLIDGVLLWVNAWHRDLRGDPRRAAAVLQEARLSLLRRTTRPVVWAMDTPRWQGPDIEFLQNIFHCVPSSHEMSRERLLWSSIVESVAIAEDGIARLPNFWRQRARPPRRPGGLEHADPQTKQRWRASGFAAPVVAFSARPIDDAVWMEASGIPSGWVREGERGSHLIPLLDQSSSVHLLRGWLGEVARCAPSTQGPQSITSWAWRLPARRDMLDDLRDAARGVAKEFEDLVADWQGWRHRRFGAHGICGPDPGEGSAPAHRAALGVQPGLHISKRGAPALLPSGLTPAEHVAQARELQHPFHTCPCIPVDLQFAAEWIHDEGDPRSAMKRTAS